jgi:hypothetical protein
MAGFLRVGQPVVVMLNMTVAAQNFRLTLAASATATEIRRLDPRRLNRFQQRLVRLHGE